MHAKSDYIFYLPVLYTEAFLNTKFLAGALRGYLKDIMTHTIFSETKRKAHHKRAILNFTGWQI